MDGYIEGDACAPDARNNGEKAGRMASAELSTMFNRSTYCGVASSNILFMSSDYGG